MVQSEWVIPWKPGFISSYQEYISECIVFILILFRSKCKTSRLWLPLENVCAVHFVNPWRTNLEAIFFIWYYSLRIFDQSLSFVRPRFRELIKLQWITNETVVRWKATELKWTAYQQHTRNISFVPGDVL